jgi:hypothetical protein
VPGHIETIVRFANFERRISPGDLAAAELVYASQLGLDNVDVLTQTAIVTLYAKFLWQVRKDIDGARAIFKTGEGKFDSKFYFSNYIKFEMDQPGTSLFLHYMSAVMYSSHCSLFCILYSSPSCSSLFCESSSIAISCSSDNSSLFFHDIIHYVEMAVKTYRVSNDRLTLFFSFLLY